MTPEQVGGYVGTGLSILFFGYLGYKISNWLFDKAKKTKDQ